MIVDLIDLPEIQNSIRSDGFISFYILSYSQFIKFVHKYELQIPDVNTIIDLDGEHQFVIVGAASYSDFVCALEFSGTINEKRYLLLNPDVSAGIKNGMVASARDHYLVQGYLEERPAVILKAGETSARPRLTRSSATDSRRA